MSRTREPDLTLFRLPGPVWVKCPRCARPAQVMRLPGPYPLAAHVKLRCAHCGFAQDEARFTNSDIRRATIARWKPRCDRCGRPARYGAPGTPKRHGPDFTIDWTCPGCRHVTRFPAAVERPSERDGCEPWFGLPLVLSEQVGAHLVWAYNLSHVAMLETWLGAALRERSHSPYYMTMMARLPRWMKVASARPKMLAALARLRDRAEREGLS